MKSLIIVIVDLDMNSELLNLDNMRGEFFSELQNFFHIIYKLVSGETKSIIAYRKIKSIKMVIFWNYMNFFFSIIQMRSIKWKIHIMLSYLGKQKNIPDFYFISHQTSCNSDIYKFTHLIIFQNIHHTKYCPNLANTYKSKNNRFVLIIIESVWSLFTSWRLYCFIIWYASSFIAVMIVIFIKLNIIEIKFLWIVQIF